MSENNLPALEQIEESTRLIAKAMADMYRILMNEGEMNSDHAIELTKTWIQAVFGQRGIDFDA